MTIRMPNPVLDVERELSIAVKLAGGRRVDELTGAKPGHRIADFLFDEYEVVAELKCLEKDQINDPSFIDKVSRLYAEQSKTDKSMPLVFGQVRMTTQGLSSDFQLKIAELYSTAVRRVVASANEQIAVTKERLPRPHHLGVLFLVNDGNSAMDPGHIVWTLGQVLKGGAFPNINHVIFFTINMSVDMPAEFLPQWLDDQTDIHVWYSGGRKDVAEINSHFEARIRNSWFDHLKSIVGRADQFDADKALLKDATNKPRV